MNKDVFLPGGNNNAETSKAALGYKEQLSEVSHLTENDITFLVHYTYYGMGDIHNQLKYHYKKLKIESQDKSKKLENELEPFQYLDFNNEKNIHKVLVILQKYWSTPCLYNGKDSYHYNRIKGIIKNGVSVVLLEEEVKESVKKTLQKQIGYFKNRGDDYYPETQDEMYTLYQLLSL